MTGVHVLYLTPYEYVVLVHIPHHGMVVGWYDVLIQGRQPPPPTGCGDVLPATVRWIPSPRHEGRVHIVRYLRDAYIPQVMSTRGQGMY